MEKDDRPEAFGVFKPVGHVIIAFREAADVDEAADALRQRGFVGKGVVRYSPQEMMAQVDADIEQASPLSSLGQELNLVKAHRALAESGCSFLVVHAPDDEQVADVVEVLRRIKPVAAQRYGRFIIEELEVSDETQVFESPARGLDLDMQPPTDKQR